MWDIDIEELTGLQRDNDIEPVYTILLDTALKIAWRGKSLVNNERMGSTDWIIDKNVKLQITVNNDKNFELLVKSLFISLALYI